jgi:hypothetical protein
MAATAATSMYASSIDPAALTRLAPPSDLGRLEARFMLRSHLPPSVKGFSTSLDPLTSASGRRRLDRYRSARGLLSESGRSRSFRGLGAPVFAHLSGVTIIVVPTPPSIQDASGNE